VAAGRHVEGIDIRVTELARRIDLRGRLTFSDGVAVANKPATFSAHAGRYRQNGRTDGEGRFEMRILAGRPGMLSGEIMISRQQASACPEAGKKFEPEEIAAFLQSTPYPVAGDVNLAEIRVVFSFPSCKAPLKRE
jgi:hypothetical protein